MLECSIHIVALLAAFVHHGLYCICNRSSVNFRMELRISEFACEQLLAPIYFPFTITASCIITLWWTIRCSSVICSANCMAHPPSGAGTNGLRQSKPMPFLPFFEDAYWTRCFNFIWLLPNDKMLQLMMNTGYGEASGSGQNINKFGHWLPYNMEDGEDYSFDHFRHSKKYCGWKARAVQWQRLPLPERFGRDKFVTRKPIAFVYSGSLWHNWLWHYTGVHPWLSAKKEKRREDIFLVTDAACVLHDVSGAPLKVWDSVLPVWYSLKRCCTISECSWLNEYVTCLPHSYLMEQEKFTVQAEYTVDHLDMISKTRRFYYDLLFLNMEAATREIDDSVVTRFCCPLFLGKFVNRQLSARSCYTCKLRASRNCLQYWAKSKAFCF